MIPSMGTRNEGLFGVSPVESRRVTFFCHAPSAETVYLIGTFNDWDPRATPMARNSNGEWCVCLNLSPGEIEYSAIIDGRRYSDPVYAIDEADPQLCEREESIMPDLLIETNNIPQGQSLRSRILGTVP